MYKFTLILLISLYCQYSFSNPYNAVQDSVKASDCIQNLQEAGFYKFHYNSNWSLTLPSCNSYYREAYFNFQKFTFVGKVKDYYSDGQLAGTMVYENGLLHGEYSFLNENGKPVQTGSFANDNREGKWQFWTKDGAPLLIVEYLPDGSEYKILDVWDKKGEHVVKNGFGKAELILAPNSEPEWDSYGEDVAILTGNIKDGKFDGRWEAKIGDRLVFSEYFKDGEFKRGLTPKYINTSLESIPYKGSSRITVIPPQQNKKATSFHVSACNENYTLKKGKPAQYPGGLKALYVLLERRFKMPDMAVKNMITGNVVINITVDEAGNPVKFTPLSHLGYEIEEEIIKILSATKNWKPAELNGKQIQSTTTIRWNISSNGIGKIAEDESGGAYPHKVYGQ